MNRKLIVSILAIILVLAMLASLVLAALPVALQTQVLVPNVSCKAVSAVYALWGIAA